MIAKTQPVTEPNAIDTHDHYLLVLFYFVSFSTSDHHVNQAQYFIYIGWEHRATAGHGREVA